MSNEFVKSVLSSYTDEQKRAVARAIAMTNDLPKQQTTTCEFTDRFLTENGHTVAQFHGWTARVEVRTIRTLSVEYVPAFTQDGEAIGDGTKLLYLRRFEGGAWITVYKDTSVIDRLTSFEN